MISHVVCHCRIIIYNKNKVISQKRQGVLIETTGRFK